MNIVSFNIFIGNEIDKAQKINAISCTVKGCTWIRRYMVIGVV